jgi:tetratricopeptide (TPR) repeat protein
MRPIATTAIAAIFWLAACVHAHAQVSIVETRMFSTAERKLGAEWREDLQRVMEAIESGDPAAAERLLQPIRTWCDASQRPGRPVVSVANTAEYDLYMAGRNDGEPTEWIDIACPTAYHLTGYLYAGMKRMPEAMPWLDRAIALAPYFPDPRNERAFVLAQTASLPEALAAYRDTLALAEAHPSAACIRPLSLRGIGYVLVEMGDLDGAQASYEASLQIDPDNETAKNELEYIARQREAASPH